MSLYSAYQSLWLPGVLSAGSAFDGGSRDWIIHKSWLPDAKLTSKKSVMSVYDSTDLIDALVNDFLLFSTAAFESAVSINEFADEPRACAWQLISYYYSAYFSANAIMRLGGYLCSYLDPATCSEINERASLSNLGGVDDRSKLSPAMFFGVYSSQGSTLVLQMLSGVKGGVHIQFWAGFLRFLDAIQEEIKSTPLVTADKKIALFELMQLKSSLTLTGKRNGSWLSDVRNAVNYRFENGVWFPYSDNDVTSGALRSSLRNGFAGSVPMIAPTTPASDCRRLVSVSGFLLRWIGTSLVLMQNKVNKNRGRIIRDGAMAFAAKI